MCCCHLVDISCNCTCSLRAKPNEEILKTTENDTNMYNNFAVGFISNKKTNLFMRIYIENVKIVSR